jgi:hypothetical protein
MSADIRLTVLLKPVEYAELKRKAGLVPLSTWIRSQVCSGVVELADTQLPQGPESVAGIGTPIKARKRASGRAGLGRERVPEAHDAGSNPAPAIKEKALCGHPSAPGLHGLKCKQYGCPNYVDAR